MFVRSFVHSIALCILKFIIALPLLAIVYLLYVFVCLLHVWSYYVCLYIRSLPNIGSNIQVNINQLWRDCFRCQMTWVGHSPPCRLWSLSVVSRVSLISISGWTAAGNWLQTSALSILCASISARSMALAMKVWYFTSDIWLLFGRRNVMLNYISLIFIASIHIISAWNIRLLFHFYHLQFFKFHFRLEC